MPKLYNFQINFNTSKRNFEDDTYKPPRKVTQYALKTAINDKDGFISNSLEEHTKEQNSQDIDLYISRYFLYDRKHLKECELEYIYTEPQRIKEKIFQDPHYAQAFQGGGAKGLAYVGVKKALEQNAEKRQKEIQLKSIIGSSAGGIFALAVSTGISYKQLLKICYQMKKIPCKDKIDHNYLGSTQQQNKQKKTKIQQIIKESLERYGLFSKSWCQFVKNRFLKDQLFNALLEVIKGGSQSIGELLTLKNPNDGCKFNYYGLLLHGALMTGDSIGDIAAKCLQKYFIKRINEAKQLKIEQQKLSLPFTDLKWKTIITSIYDDMKQDYQVDNISLTDIFKNINQVNNKKDFMVTVINKYLVYLSELEEYKAIQLNYQYFNKLFQAQHLQNEQINFNKYQQQNRKKFLLNINQIQLRPNYQQELKKLPEQKNSLVYFLKSLFPHVQNKIMSQEHSNNQQMQVNIDYTNQRDIASIIYQTVQQFNQFSASVDSLMEVKQIKDKKLTYQSLIKNMKSITLEEYYQINGVELTCTSVDLNDRTMRLFNHKTTPKLPVYKAVQMTGSFPVGFKSQIWNPQWGTYNIYFQYMKRQIDLNRHEFTDGGMLANFPFKYLDNDEIRDKYFSHSRKNTIFLGFGLDAISQKSKGDSLQNYEENIAAEKLNQVIANLKGWRTRISGAWQLMTTWSQSNNPVDIDILSKSQQEKMNQFFDNLPLIKFIDKLLSAYPNADRNFNMQCFSNRILSQNLSDLDDQHQNVKGVEINYQDKYKTLQNHIKRQDNFMFNKKPKLSVKINKIQYADFCYQALFNNNVNEQYQDLLKKNQIVQKDLINFSQNASANIIKCQQILVLHNFVKLKDYIEVDKQQDLSKLQQNVDLKYKYQNDKKQHKMIKQQQEEDINNNPLAKSYKKSLIQDYKHSTEKSLKVLKQKMLQVMLQKTYYLEQREIKDYTIDLEYRKMIIEQKIFNQCKNWTKQQIKQKVQTVISDINKVKQIRKKLQDLAISLFNRLYENRQFDQIMKLGNFKEYRKNYYENVQKKIIALKAPKKAKDIKQLHDGQKNRVKLLIQDFNQQKLEQFLHIKQKLITNNFQSFFYFIFYSSTENIVRQAIIFRNSNQSQEQQHIKTNEQVLRRIKNNLNKITIEQIIKKWDQIWREEKLESQESIVNKYFQWKIYEKMENLIHKTPQKFIEAIRLLFIAKKQKKEDNIFNSQQTQVLTTIFNSLTQIQIQPPAIQQLSLSKIKLQNKLLQYIGGDYQKQHIFAQPSSTGPSIMKILVEKWIKKQIQQYKSQTKLVVLNIFQYQRIAHFIDFIKIALKGKNQSERQKQYKEYVKNILINNSNGFYYDIMHGDATKIFAYGITQTQRDQIKKKLEQFYKVCTDQIVKFQLSIQQKKNQNSLNDQNSKDTNSKQQSIFINFNVYNLIKNIFMQQQNIFTQKMKELKYWKEIIEKIPWSDYSFLMRFTIIQQSMQQYHISKSHQQILQKLYKNKQNQRANIYELYQLYHDDFKFIKDILERICKLTAEMFLAKSNKQKIGELLDYWKKKIQSTTNYPHLLVEKKKIIERCLHYYGLLEKYSIDQVIAQKSQQNKADSTGTITTNQGSRQISEQQYMNKKNSVPTSLQQVVVSKQKIQQNTESLVLKKQSSATGGLQKFKQIINKLQKNQTILLLQQNKLPSQKQNIKQIIKQIKKLFSDWQQVQLKLISNDVLYNNLHIVQQLYSNILSLYRNNQLKQAHSQKINQQMIKNLFIFHHLFFDRMLEFKNNSFLEFSKLFHQFKNRKFSNDLLKVDLKFISRQVLMNLNNKIITVLNDQIKMSHIGNIGKIQQGKQIKGKKISAHLVLEGVRNSHIYYHNYFRNIQDNFFRVSSRINANQKDKTPNVFVSLQAITCSNFHSVYGFLVASGMSYENLRVQMNLLEDIALTLQSGINHSFDSMNWTQCSKSDIKYCLDEVWQNGASTVYQLQKLYRGNSFNIETINNVRLKYMAEKDRILAACQLSFDEYLEFLSEKMSHQTYLSSKQQRKITIAKTLGFDHKCEKGKHPYDVLNRDSTILAKKLFVDIFDRFQSFMEMFITSQPIIYRNIKVDKYNKTQIWKGILMQKLYTTFKLKQYICQHLKSMKLSPDITLEQFHNKISRKILLTFTTLNVDENRIEFINKNTFPNMPVWAAILAASSVGFFYKEFKARKQWQPKQNQVTSLYETISNSLKKQKYNTKQTTNYECGNLVSSLPLQLLTNQTILKQIFKLDDTKEGQIPKFIYIALAFNTLNIKPILHNYKLTKKFLNLRNLPQVKQLLRILLTPQTIENLVKKIKGSCTYQMHDNLVYNVTEFGLLGQKLTSIFGYSNAGKALAMFTQSNDNLIMKLYYDKVIKCPIKIDTLDFHKITKLDKQSNIYLPAQKAIQTIQCSYHISSEFIEEETYKNIDLRIQLEQNQLETSNGVLQNGIKCKILFLSYSKWTKCPSKLVVITTKPKKFLKSEQTQKIVQNYQIQWTVQEPKLQLKFYYPQFDKDNPQNKNDPIYNSKKAKTIIYNEFEIQFTNIINEFNDSKNKNKQKGFKLSYTYQIDYSKLFSKQPIQITITYPTKKNNIKVVTPVIGTAKKTDLGTISISSNFQKAIFDKQLNDYKHLYRLQIQTKQNNCAFRCIKCLSPTQLIKSSDINFNDYCQICGVRDGLFKCKDIKKIKCNSNYCLPCVKLFILKKQTCGIKCLYCFYKGNNKENNKENKQIYLQPNQKIQENSCNYEQCNYCYTQRSSYELMKCSQCKINLCEGCFKNIED